MFQEFVRILSELESVLTIAKKCLFVGKTEPEHYMLCKVHFLDHRNGLNDNSSWMTD